MAKVIGLKKAGRTIMMNASDYRRLRGYAFNIVDKGRGSLTVIARIPLARLILGQVSKAGRLIDHKNRNPLDNTRKNLRPCTKAQNQQNQSKRSRPASSKYKGVTWDESRKKWMGQIQHRDLRITKRFEKEKDAARFYNRLASKYFGSFAALNRIQ